ncbi:hypothetical protein NC651_023371 [Populus alba x Populus x berolinensis]|nr:hypothetical protein NC651_023371 [Populus alba x Populus x berolinensis]
MRSLGCRELEMCTILTSVSTLKEKRPRAIFSSEIQFPTAKGTSCLFLLHHRSLIGFSFVSNINARIPN